MINESWQVCSYEQGKELKSLGINGTPMAVWHDFSKYNDSKMSEEIFFPNNTKEYMSMEDHYPAYSLAEIAIMLGYTFCPSNTKEAAEKLILEIKVGSSTVKDCNARLLEAQTI